MAEAMWTVLEIGPFPESKETQIRELIDGWVREHGVEDRITRSTEGGTVRYTVPFGSQNYGTELMFTPTGRIEDLMALDVPYVFYDDGKTGVRSGTEYSWHPHYGETVFSRDRDTHDTVMLPEDLVRLLAGLDDAEFGRIIRGYFAEVGSDEATDAVKAILRLQQQGKASK